MKNLILLAFLILSNVLFAQNNLDYALDPNFTEIQIASISSDCDGPRPNIWDFSATEREQLRDCMMAYISQENPNWQQGDPILERYPIVWDHTRNGAAAFWHNYQEVGFFTEHRNYLQGMEQYLLDNGCGEFVPLPKYDPSTNIPDEFFDASEAVVTGFGILNNQSPNYDMITVNESTCAQFSDIDAFASHVENQHNIVHGRIGGAMGNFNSPSAAIFWLWHAKVDDMYNCFQQECQNCEPVFIRATDYNSLCDYCFDFSRNENADAITITLIDDNGNETLIPWYMGQNCIPYRYLQSGASYTVRIEGSNSTSGFCNSSDEVELEFIAPTQPKSSKWQPNPCIGVIHQPQFRTSGLHPANGGETKTYLVKNTGEPRNFTFYNTVIQNGNTNQIGSVMALESQQEILITIPSSFVGYGNNYFIVEVDGDTSESQYYVVR